MAVSDTYFLKLGTLVSLKVATKSFLRDKKNDKTLDF